MTNTFATVAAIITHTPLWAWAALALLIWRGLARTQPRDVSLAGLLLTPLVLLVLSFYNLTADGVGSATLAGLGLGGILGLAAAIQLEQRFAPKALGNGRVRLPGEWTSLVTALVIFATHYVKAVAGVVAPALAHAETFTTATAAISAFFLVLTLVRTLLRLRVALAPQAAI